MRQNLIVNIFSVLYILGAIIVSLLYDLNHPEGLIIPLLLFPILNIATILTKYGFRETGVIYVTEVSEHERTARMELNETPEEFEKRSEVIFLVRPQKE